MFRRGVRTAFGGFTRGARRVFKTPFFRHCMRTLPVVGLLTAAQDPDSFGQMTTAFVMHFTNYSYDDWDHPDRGYLFKIPSESIPIDLRDDAREMAFERRHDGEDMSPMSFREQWEILQDIQNTALPDEPGFEEQEEEYRLLRQQIKAIGEVDPLDKEADDELRKALEYDYREWKRDDKQKFVRRVLADYEGATLGRNIEHPAKKLLDLAELESRRYDQDEDERDAESNPYAEDPSSVELLSEDDIEMDGVGDEIEVFEEQQRLLDPDWEGDEQQGLGEDDDDNLRSGGGLGGLRFGGIGGGGGWFPFRPPPSQ